MEESKYGKLINNKLYKVEGFLIEEGRIYVNPKEEDLRKLGYKRLEFNSSGTKAYELSEDGSRIITNMSCDEVMHNAVSPVNLINSYLSRFKREISNVVNEINFKNSYLKVLYDKVFEEDSCWCSSKTFNEYIKWKNAKCGEGWIRNFDGDAYIKNGDIETDDFFNKHHLSTKNRLTILGRIDKIQVNIKEHNKSILLTSMYIYIYTKFEDYIRKTVDIFKNEFGVCKNINVRSGIEKMLCELSQRICFTYEKFFPILCRRHSIIHSNGMLSEKRYNDFKDKCELPFNVNENITPSLDDVLKEIEIMENVFEEICEKTKAELNM